MSQALACRRPVCSLACEPAWPELAGAWGLKCAKVGGIMEVDGCSLWNLQLLRHFCF